MKAVSQWVWVAGGVIAGLIIFSIAYQQILQINLSVIERRSVEQYEEVKNIINNLCWSFSGNKREYTVNLAETIEGIYTALTPREEYTHEQIINKITNEENSTGNFLCLKIKGKRLRCEELECNTTFPFIGSLPEEFSLSALINKLMGRGSTFTYNLEFERNATDVIVKIK